MKAEGTWEKDGKKVVRIWKKGEKGESAGSRL
jgi:hypothetical protein